MATSIPSPQDLNDEAKIDDVVEVILPKMKQYGGAEFTVFRRDLPQMNKDLEKAVIDRFDAAGWTMTYVPDFPDARDDYYSFKPKAKSA